MREEIIRGQTYRLPNTLNAFQHRMYIHLINWKWKNITKDPGYYKHLGQDIEYDAILPDRYIKPLRILYEPIRDRVKSHSDNKAHRFKLHKHFNHMASSQAANANLFLPILINPNVNSVLKILKQDFDSLATDQLDNGFQIEFWGPRNGKGLLNDHNARAGTDSDIAIAYYNKSQEPCLWLIEHKLTEEEFTKCGGYNSKGKKRCLTCNCNSSFAEIMANPSLCYYHQKSKYRYWEITRDSSSFFVNNSQFVSCPFRGGINQLWRNQLLGLALEKGNSKLYKHVYFSVCKHPGNTSLDKTISVYKKLIADNPKFSVFTSDCVVQAAKAVHDTELDKWVEWYRGLYNL